MYLEWQSWCQCLTVWVWVPTSKFLPHSYHHQYKIGDGRRQRFWLIFISQKRKLQAGRKYLVEENEGVSYSTLCCHVKSTWELFLFPHSSFSVPRGCEPTDHVSVKNMSAVFPPCRSAFDILPNWTSRGASCYVGFSSFSNLEKV